MECRGHSFLETQMENMETNEKKTPNAQRRTLNIDGVQTPVCRENAK